LPVLPAVIAIYACHHGTDTMRRRRDFRFP